MLLQASLSLSGNQFSSSPYLDVHVGHEESSQELGQIIAGIDNPRDVLHDNLSLWRRRCKVGSPQ